jgi:hypothetical protein
MKYQKLKRVAAPIESSMARLGMMARSLPIGVGLLRVTGTITMSSEEK